MQLIGTNVSWKIKNNNILWLQIFRANNIEPHENFTSSCEKSVEVLDELQDAQNFESYKGK